MKKSFLSLAATALAAKTLAESVLLTLPANENLINLGFDLMRMKPAGAIEMVCYGGFDEVKTLEFFDRAQRRWVAIPQSSWTRGNLRSAATGALVIVGDGQAATDLLDTATWANNILTPDGHSFHDIANAVHSVMPLSRKQWKALEAGYGITYREIAAPSRYDRGSRYDRAPARPAAGVQAAPQPAPMPANAPVVELPEPDLAPSDIIITVREPAIEAPAVEAPAIETPAIETPAIETPVLEAPALEAPALEAPALEAPAAEAPVLETPPVETPAVETPAIETPVLEAPALEAPALETPAVEAPALETPAVEAPARPVCAVLQTAQARGLGREAPALEAPATTVQEALEKAKAERDGVRGTPAPAVPAIEAPAVDLDVPPPPAVSPAASPAASIVIPPLPAIPPVAARPMGAAPQAAPAQAPAE